MNGWKHVQSETERKEGETERDGRKTGVEALTAGADVALVAVEEAISDPDVCPCGRVA